MYNNQYKKPKQQLDDIVTGGIYEYVRQDNQEVVYVGSSGSSLMELDSVHRDRPEWIPPKKHPNDKKGYQFTVFRTNLRREEFAKLVEPRWVHEPRTITRRALLILERDVISDRISKGQCMLNHTPDPLKSWIKNNS